MEVENLTEEFGSQATVAFPWKLETSFSEELGSQYTPVVAVQPLCGEQSGTEAALFHRHVLCFVITVFVV